VVAIGQRRRATLLIAAIAGYRIRTVAIRGRRPPGDAHDRIVDSIELMRLVLCRCDLEIYALHIKADELVEPLPYLHRDAGCDRVSKETLAVEHLEQPIQFTKIGLDHSNARLGRHRPKPLKHTIELGSGERELLPNRPQAPAADYRLGDHLVTFLDRCVHA